MKESIFYKELYDLRDEKYRVFNHSLVPNISIELMLGVRVPDIRNLAKKAYRENRSFCDVFLDQLPHRYFEENNLHACIIEQIKDFDEALKRTEAFLVYIDNWATCDIFSPKLFKKYPKEILGRIESWIASEHCYTIRYGIGLLLSNFLDKEFKKEQMESVAKIRSEEYYVNMMRAWYFSTVLVKQWDEGIKVFEKNRLDDWTHNKAIQKSIESKRISDDRKEYLRSLKIKR